MMTLSSFCQTDTTSNQELITITKNEYVYLGRRILFLETENQSLKNEVQSMDEIIRQFELSVSTFNEVISIKNEIITQGLRIEQLQQDWIADQKKLLRKQQFISIGTSFGTTLVITAILVPVLLLK